MSDVVEVGFSITCKQAGINVLSHFHICETIWLAPIVRIKHRNTILRFVTGDVYYHLPAETDRVSQHLCHVNSWHPQLNIDTAYTRFNLLQG